MLTLDSEKKPGQWQIIKNIDQTNHQLVVKKYVVNLRYIKIHSLTCLAESSDLQRVIGDRSFNQ